jgi:cation diffusion facilitator family transporter
VAGSSKRTARYAIAANAAVAVVKGVAGAVTGSSALLAEAAHSVAGMLRASLSLSERPPDEEDPFGYSKERFFWTLLASIIIFLAGAAFAVGHGTLTLLRPPAKRESFGIVYATIAFVFVAEGISLWRAAARTRREVSDAGVPLLKHVRQSKDPTVKTVLSEDTAAIAGLLIALVGTVLAQATGKSAFESC